MKGKHFYGFQAGVHSRDTRKKKNGNEHVLTHRREMLLRATTTLGIHPNHQPQPAATPLERHQPRPPVATRSNSINKATSEATTCSNHTGRASTQTTSCNPQQQHKQGTDPEPVAITLCPAATCSNHTGHPPMPQAAETRLYRHRPRPPAATCSNHTGQRPRPPAAHAGTQEMHAS